MQKREWNIEILRRLGWTQAEIGEAVGLTKQRIGQMSKGIAESLKLSKTHQIEEVADAYNMSYPLAADRGTGQPRGHSRPQNLSESSTRRQ